MLNEIAAHAEGALHYDRRVDTIFEIGGQDAKYIRLADGRVVDAAMNEACSAGTGSFIEEQGRQVPGHPRRGAARRGGAGRRRRRLARPALLGVHGRDHRRGRGRRASTAAARSSPGIYDSIIQNYLNRVKGSRSVGQVDLLPGHALRLRRPGRGGGPPDRQRGDRPAQPGHRRRPRHRAAGAEGRPARGAAQRGRSTRSASWRPASSERTPSSAESTQGCGGAATSAASTACTTVVEGERQRFTWGGGCSLYDRGTGKRKLPDLAPDPFREREALVAEVIRRTATPRGGRRVALTDEFALKGLFPFFATFLHELGLDLVVAAGAGPERRSSAASRRPTCPFCAPMQQYHGLVGRMARASRRTASSCRCCADPAASGNERLAVVCPIVQASPDVLRRDLGRRRGARVAVSRSIDIGPQGLRLARVSSRAAASWPRRWGAAELAGGLPRGRRRPSSSSTRRAASSAGERWTSAASTIWCRWWCSAAPTRSTTGCSTRTCRRSCASRVRWPSRSTAIRCADDVPVFDDIYWGYGQRNLRAAHQIRRTPGLYSLCCSNYSCGPDSFNLHFYAYADGGQAVRHHRDRRPLGRRRHQDAGRGLPALRARGARGGGAARRAERGHRDPVRPTTWASALCWRATRPCSSRAWGRGPRRWRPACAASASRPKPCPSPTARRCSSGAGTPRARSACRCASRWAACSSASSGSRTGRGASPSSCPPPTGPAASASTTCCTSWCSSAPACGTACGSGRPATRTTSTVCPAA